MRLLWLVLWSIACNSTSGGHHAEEHKEPLHGVAVVPPVPLPDGVGVRYGLSFPAPHTHMFEVEATAAASGDQMVWMMPTWTPGSYLMREYARHVEGLVAVAEDGTARPVRKVSKNRWEVTTQGAAKITLRYRLYAREMSVRTNWVDADFAMLNGAPTFITPVDALESAYEVQLTLPEGWARSETGLDAHIDGAPHHYVARDFDELVDSPIVAGNPVVHDFEVAGVPHVLVNLGGDGVWDQERSLDGVERITEAQVKFWGEVPYARYVYLNVISEAGGGLEHLDSTLMLTSRDRTQDDDDYERWLGLVSHEFFHTWNVKRMRPVALGPFDYEHEVYTPSLWIAEGVTSYYDDLLLVRAGLLDPSEHLGRLSSTIGKLQGKPGRLVQPLTTASHDAWIKFYRPDENSPNTSVSYYGKGSVVAWLLDTEIRRHTDDRYSLDDVMRRMYRDHSGERGYSEAEFRAVVSEVAGHDLSDWFARYVDGVEELDFAPALAWWGLTFPEPTSEDTPDAWMGVSSGGDVRQVERGTPVWHAGLNVGDEILAVDGFRTSGSLATVLRRHAPGDEVEVLVSRRGKLRTLNVTLEAEGATSWSLSIDRLAGSATKLRRTRWWGGHE